jgi:DNA adenine methylase
VALNGGKFYMAKKIVEMMPPRCKNPNAPSPDDTGYLTYLEPYFGGGSVLFANDPEGISEIVNDIDKQLTNFWKVLQNKEHFETFLRLCEATPFSELQYQDAQYYNAETDNLSTLAWKFFIRNRQSRQGLGTCFATLSKNRTRRGMNEQAASWLSAIEGLEEFHKRLQRVVILTNEATWVIRQHDSPRTFFYCDPPYMHETRHGGRGGEYKYEMRDDQHQQLLETLSKIKGRFILSSYASELYSNFAMKHGWKCDHIDIDNKSSGAKVKEIKTECLWRNYG